MLTVVRIVVTLSSASGRWIARIPLNIEKLQVGRPYRNETRSAL